MRAAYLYIIYLHFLKTNEKQNLNLLLCAKERDDFLVIQRNSTLLSLEQEVLC